MSEILISSKQNFKTLCQKVDVLYRQGYASKSEELENLRKRLENFFKEMYVQQLQKDIQGQEHTLNALKTV